MAAWRPCGDPVASSWRDQGLDGSRLRVREGVRGHRVTQVRDRRPRRPHLAYLRKCNGGGKSDKGQGFGCDKEGPGVLLWPRLSPWLSIARGHPGAGSRPHTRRAAKSVFRTQV
ncbi:unnamed protein product [Pleuronectes platessa]|uniref:Uncharacterized protein n=1 Tax=Pleuronectes platessa TaxID=8262 RepID=A0A9N7UBC9_PLEPL|nr:unnamed protein product [Pleuronectes platessa]